MCATYNPPVFQLSLMAWQGDLAVKETSFPGIYEYLANAFPPIVITAFLIF